MGDHYKCPSIRQFSECSEGRGEMKQRLAISQEVKIRVWGVQLAKIWGTAKWRKRKLHRQGNEDLFGILVRY